MSEPEDLEDQDSKDRDDPVVIPLDFEEAMKGLLAVEPDEDGEPEN